MNFSAPAAPEWTLYTDEGHQWEDAMLAFLQDQDYCVAGLMGSRFLPAYVRKAMAYDVDGYFVGRNVPDLYLSYKNHSILVDAKTHSLKKGFTGRHNVEANALRSLIKHQEFYRRPVVFAFNHDGKVGWMSVDAFNSFKSPPQQDINGNKDPHLQRYHYVECGCDFDTQGFLGRTADQASWLAA